MDQFISRSSFIFLLVVVIAKASQVHTIKAGFEGNFVFDPDTTTASVGDLVVFQFFPTNHSVVRGEYAQSESCGDAGCNPCVPYELIHPGQQGFNSGNVLTQTTSTDGNGPTFNITIGDSYPIWFYCTALDSCHPYGMVGVINPATGQSISIQKSAAINAHYQLAPGQPWPAEGSLPSSQSTSAATSTESNSTTGGHISSVAIAGIVLLLVIALIAGLFFAFRRYRRRNPLTGPEEASAPPSETKDDDENTIPIGIRYEQPSSPSVQNDPVSPVTPPVPRRSIRRIFYKYPFSEKPGIRPEGHPAFGPNSIQDNTIELQGDEPFNGASR